MNNVPEWQTEEYWLELRKETSFRYRQGQGFCDTWCEETIRLLPEELGFEKQTAVQGECEGLKNSRANHHTWLQKPENGKVFIADGTPRQFVDDDKYNRGFYGWLEEAPDELIDIYASDWLFDGLFGD